jgi:hypothetical protein
VARPSTIILASSLCLAAIPACAAWSRIGSLDVAAGKTEQFSMEKFKGNVIGLTARQSEVICDRVTATFANGDMRPIFKGKLPKGVSIRVDLPPGIVSRVSFNCHPMAGHQATLDLAADSGAQKPKLERRG